MDTKCNLLVDYEAEPREYVLWLKDRDTLLTQEELDRLCRMLSRHATVNKVDKLGQDPV